MSWVVVKVSSDFSAFSCFAPSPWALCYVTMLQDIGLPSLQNSEKYISFLYKWPSLWYSVIAVKNGVRHLSDLSGCSLWHLSFQWTCVLLFLVFSTSDVFMAHWLHTRHKAAFSAFLIHNCIAMTGQISTQGLYYFDHVNINYITSET
jgi:hypothetical protein